MSSVTPTPATPAVAVAATTDDTKRVVGDDDVDVDGEAVEGKGNLGDAIKALEHASETHLDSTKPFVIRLDGHGFSKFTKGFTRPVDARITYAMTETTQDLLTEFNACAAYTQSDEITLIFPSVNVELKQTPLYGGRIQKIASLTAGFATARFNLHLASREFGDTDKERELRAKATGARAYFDSRVFNCPDNQTAMMAMFWRHRYDAYRNAISNLAMCHFSSKQTHKVNTKDKIKMLEEKGVLLSQYPPSMLYGTFLKREQYELKARDPKSGADVVVLRTRVHRDSYAWHGSKEERTDWVFRKYWRVTPLTEVPADDAPATAPTE